MSILKLVSPWTEYYRKVQAMFAEDEDIKVYFDEENVEIKIYVAINTVKAAAIEKLLPSEQTFGNVTIKISVIPSNKDDEDISNDPAYLFANAFRDNKALVRIETLRDPSMNNDMVFVVFKPKVVQYYADNISSLTGLVSCLYEDLAVDLFSGIKSVFFSTDRVQEKKNMNMYYPIYDPCFGEGDDDEYDDEDDDIFY